MNDLMGWLGLIGIIFTIYHYFKNPQIKGEKFDALLKQQVEFICKINEERFKGIQANFIELLSQNKNHIHTIDIKVDKLSGITEDLSKAIVKLETIIEERIPKK